MLAGVMTVSLDTPDAVAGIADAVDSALLVGPYHEAVGAVINQHGFNLLWIGAFTLVGAFYIWRTSVTAMFFTGIVGGLADVGYFIFLDLGGFVNFVPGTIMTLVSSAATILSLIAYFMGIRGQEAIKP
jgi:CHASE2 domain-containing sensor protein